MAKYDKRRKLERNAAIKQYRIEHTELSYQEIADVFNLDVSRVWRIINGKKKQN